VTSTWKQNAMHIDYYIVFTLDLEVRVWTSQWRLFCENLNLETWSGVGDKKYVEMAPSSRVEVKL